MFVPHKPWSFGNEYHDTGCAESDIIWALELREGKDHPPSTTNLLTTLEKQWEHCYFSQNLFGVVAESLLGDMDDNALAQSCVLFFVGCDHGQCAKCSNLLPKKD